MLPIEFTNRMKILLEDEYNTFLSSYDRQKFQALRINTLKCNSDILTLLTDKVLDKVPWCNTGFYYDEDIRPGKHPLHEAGAYYIQEPSAMSPATYLEAKPGDIILDLCAAPGGKSTQIACAMKGEGLLISNEIIPSRAKILSENIERLGIRNAVVTNESPERLCEFFVEFFDKIMVDAPCSGEGMFRKNGDACEEWSVENIKICSKRQAEILEYAASMLKPGGRMVYSTCTFAPEENELNILRFLNTHPEFHIVKPDLYEGMSSGNPDYLKICKHEDFNLKDSCLQNSCFNTSDFSSSDFNDSDFNGSSYDNSFYEDLKHTIRLLPHKLNGEGHFVAVLEKKISSDNISKDNKKIHSIKGVSEKSIKDYIDFCDSFLTERPSGIPVMFGNQLNLLPECCPSLDKIKVLRAGLNLGTFLKNRFEPSHSLAMALKPDEVKNNVDLSIVDERIYKYINGETFEYSGKKGWYLITVEGISIGFGKLVGDVMKNHYPKGLRKNLR